MLRAKFPHNPILHYACSSLLTENNGKSNTVRPFAFSVVFVDYVRILIKRA